MLYCSQRNSTATGGVSSSRMLDGAPAGGDKGSSPDSVSDQPAVRVVLDDEFEGWNELLESSKELMELFERRPACNRGSFGIRPRFKLIKEGRKKRRDAIESQFQVQAAIIID